jgi:hypothetical protein
MVPSRLIHTAWMQLIRQCDTPYPHTEIDFKAGTLYARFVSGGNLRNVDKWKKRNEIN